MAARRLARLPVLAAMGALVLAAPLGAHGLSEPARAGAADPAPAVGGAMGAVPAASPILHDSIVLPAISILGPLGVSDSGRGIASGRVEDVEADPFDPTGKHLLAISDQALWESADDGMTWHLLPGLDRFGQFNFSTTNLAFDPASSGVVLLASTSDNLATTQRGIYRSTDGGRTWTQPAHFQAACDDGSVGYPTAVTFFGHTAWAAGGCSIGESTDDGATWTWSQPDAGGAFQGIAVDIAGTPIACGTDGLFELHDGMWRRVIDFRGGGWTLGSPFNSCRVTASPFSPEHVFFTGVWSNLKLIPGKDAVFSDVVEAFGDVFHGYAWQDLNGPAHPNGRESFAEIRLRTDQKGFAFDLYWNSTDAWYFQPCLDGTGFQCTPAARHNEDPTLPPWRVLSYPALHADAGHVLFQPNAPYCIRLIADDGGIQRPGTGNCDGTSPDWTYADRGIHALQAYDMAITSIGGARPTDDVYVATQDNGGYALLSGATGWAQADGGNDGFAVDATGRATQATLGQIRVFYQGNGVQHIAGRGFSDFRDAPAVPFNAPWTGLMSPQQIATLPGGRLAMVSAPTATAGLAALFLSADGTHWTRATGHVASFVGRLTRDGLGRIVGAEGRILVLAEGTVSAPVLYVQSFSRLYRVTGITSTGSTTRASSRPVLAGDDVGPFAAGDATHLLAYACPLDPGCGSGRLLKSSDGGLTWQPLALITDLVQTDGFGNTYPANSGDAYGGEVQSVAVSPINPNVLAVGTRDTGLFLSGDGGASWERVPIVNPNINNLRFDDAGRLFVNSYGRGVSRLTPAPDRLSVTGISQSSSGSSRAFSLTATARNATGHSLSRLPLTFTLLDSSGAVLSTVAATTASDGTATGAFRSVARGSYTVVIRWAPLPGQELVTQQRVTIA
jgi:hypothetical protein